MAKKGDSTLSTTGWLVILLGCLFVLAYLAKMPSLGFDSALSHGFAHPLEGWDHIVTMIAVGIWAAQLRGHAIWLLPLAFVGVMSLGGVAGAAGILLPAVEVIILLSCAVFSLFIFRRIKFSNRVNLCIVAFFAFFHGFAHGQEISASASLISYSLGFMLATLLLHGTGILVAKVVLFCLTCFLAILLPNLAQATQSQSNSKAHSNFDPTVRQIDFDRKLPWRQKAMNHFYSGSMRLAVNDFNIQFKSFCAAIPSEDEHTKFAYEFRTQLSGQAEINKAKGFSVVSVKLSLFHQTVFDAPGAMLPLAFIRQDDGLNIAAAFKHYFPDINYTPGQALLSNGVGLTSPPVRIPVCAIRLFRISLFSFVEDRVLLQTINEVSDHLLPLISTSGKLIHTDYLFCTPRFNSVAGITDSANPNSRPNDTFTFTSQIRTGTDGEILQSCYTT